jgi:transcriptional regulator with XRE-family HTH domain
MRTYVRMAGRKRKDETVPKLSVELARSLGLNLRRLRKERGYSQEALAFRADIHRTEVGLLERGQRDAGFNVITKLAGALEVDPGEFFSGTTFVPSESGGEPHFAYDPPEAAP